MKHTQTLGKGLAALLGDDVLISDAPSSITLDQIQPNKSQPRRYFDEDSLKELVASIREKGVLQPLLVRKLDNNYEIIAGERRWRAAREVGLFSIPVIILDCSDEEALEIGLIENLQRDNLNPLEEAESLGRLIAYHNKTQENVAKAIGKSRSYVANILRLNNLPETLKDLLRQGKLSAGHARALINSPNSINLGEQIVANNLSVRETEDLVRKNKKIRPLVPPTELDQDMEFLAQKIKDIIKVPMSLSLKKNKIILNLEFSNWEQLDDLCQLLQTTVTS